MGKNIFSKKVLSKKISVALGRGKLDCQTIYCFSVNFNNSLFLNIAKEEELSASWW